MELDYLFLCVTVPPYLVCVHSRALVTSEQNSFGPSIASLVRICRFLDFIFCFHGQWNEVPFWIDSPCDISFSIQMLSFLFLYPCFFLFCFCFLFVLFFFDVVGFTPVNDIATRSLLLHSSEWTNFHRELLTLTLQCYFHNMTELLYSDCLVAISSVSMYGTKIPWDLLLGPLMSEKFICVCIIVVLHLQLFSAWYYQMIFVF